MIDGKVDETKTETVNVGGWHVSQYLKQAVTWRDHKEAAGVRFQQLHFNLCSKINCIFKFIIIRYRNHNLFPFSDITSGDNINI